MTEPVVLRVYGTPVSQGSKSAFVRGGRAVLVEGKGPGRQAHAAWRQAVATAARDWQTEHGGLPLLDGPVALSMAFTMPKPASAPKRKKWADRKPDLDKLIRAVLDSLTGVVLADDARVVQLVSQKRYATDGEPPGCTVELSRALDVLVWIDHGMAS